MSSTSSSTSSSPHSSPPTTPTTPPSLASLRYPSTNDFFGQRQPLPISIRFFPLRAHAPALLPPTTEEPKSTSTNNNNNNNNNNSNNNNSSSNSNSKKKDSELTAGGSGRGKLKTENTSEDLVVKPLKWTEFETHYRNNVHLIPATLRFPSDDISVETWPKPLRVLWNLAPSPFEAGIVDPATRNTISILFSDYTTVNHKYKNFRLGKAKNWRQAAHGTSRFHPAGIHQSPPTSADGSPRMALVWADSKISPVSNVRSSVTLLPDSPLLPSSEDSNEEVPTNTTDELERSADRPLTPPPPPPPELTEIEKKTSLGIPISSVNQKSGSFLVLNNINNNSNSNSNYNSSNSNYNSNNNNYNSNNNNYNSNNNNYNSNNNNYNNLRRSSDVVVTRPIDVRGNDGSPAQSPVLGSSPPSSLSGSPPAYRRLTMDGSEVRRNSESDDVRNLSGEIRSNLLVKPFPQFSTLDLLIEHMECKLNLEVEPLFCTISVYDVEKQLKISENFHFVLNGDMLPDRIKSTCEMYSRRCVFNTPVHGRIYYVLRVCNLFRGVSGKDSAAIYVKAKSNQNMESFKKDLREKSTLFTTLQGTPFEQFPKQQLAWAAFPAFDKGPSGWSVRGEDVPLKCDTFFLFKTNQTDAEICNILSSEKEMRKNKATFGTLSMKVRPVLGEISRYADVVISPSGVPVIPCTKLDTTERWQYVRELEQFIPAAIPNSEFVNNLYVYPEYVHLRTTKANLQITVQIVESIETYPWKLVRATYPPGGVVDFEGDPDSPKRAPKLELFDVSAVNYKSETPYYYDEFKLKIPLNLKSHCLLFTFHHINPSSRKDFKSILGYAAIPLFSSENRILRDGTYTMTIVPQPKNIDIVPRTSEDALAKLSYIRFRTRLSSTVFTQDDVLSNLFESATTNPFSISTYDSIRSLNRADKVECVRFFPVVAAHIFKVMCDNHNKLEGGPYTSTNLTAKDMSSPRSSRAHTVSGSSAGAGGNDNTTATNPNSGIQRPHSVETIGQSHPPLVRLISNLSSPAVSSSSNSVPPPRQLETPSPSDSESESEPEIASPRDSLNSPRDALNSPREPLSSPREMLNSPREMLNSPRERAGSFSGESSSELRHDGSRAATISGGPLPPIYEAKGNNTMPSPKSKRSFKSKLTLHTALHDSAPNLREVSHSTTPHAAAIFNPNRHSFGSHTPNTLNDSSPSVPPPNGVAESGGQVGSESPEIADSPRINTPPPRSPKSSSASFGVGSSRFKFPHRFTLSPHQTRKINKEEDSDTGLIAEESIVRHRKNMKASDFGVGHEDIAKEAFYSLVTLLQVVDGASSKFMEKSDEASPILAHYIHFIFNLPQVYEPLSHYWKLALNEKHQSVQGFKLNWVFFSIITKSMALHLHYTSLFLDDFNRPSRFRVTFCNNLKALVPFFVPNFQTQRGFDAFTEFPLFVNDLFPLLDRGVILDLVHTYITTIDKKEDIFRVTAVFSFLKTICDYEHFLPLNVPVATEAVDSVIDLNAKFWHNHFLIGILLTEVENCFKKAVAARTQALSTLKALVKKHEIDPRYQDPKTKQHITCMYFPFVLMVIERIETVSKFELSEKTDIYRVLLWIVSNLSSNLLRSWFVRDTQRRQAGFLSMLETSIDLLGPAYGDAICDIIEYVIADCSDDLATQTPLLESLMRLTAKALSLTANVYTFCRVVGLVESLVKVAHDPFFLGDNNMCEVLCYELFLVTNHGNENIRGRASKLVFFLMQKNLEETSNIARTKAQATIAISRLVGAGKLQDYANFHHSMTELMELEKALRANNGEVGTKRGVVEETAVRILNLVKDTAKLASTNDSESVAEIYYRISIGYSDTPNMRLTWLNNLANHHLKCKCRDEAAQAHLLSAYLIAQYHHSLNPSNPPLLPSLFQSVCSNAEKEPPLGPIQKGQFQETIWGVKSLVTQLESATKYFTEAGHLDLTLEVLSLIAIVHKAQRAYPELSQILEKTKSICDVIIQREKKKEPRTSYKFYRIGFYGAAFEDDSDGIEFIYKMPAECHINTMQLQIKEQLQQKSPKQEVILLKNEEVSRTSLDPHKSYYQVLSVEPYFEPTEAHLAGFGPHFNCQHFIAEVALNFEGKLAQEGDLARQQKRKTVFTTTMRFPHFSNRLVIKEKRDIILTPLENAIEQLGNRTALIRAQLDCSPPRINPLQQIIQGSVSPMVNEGPLKICETFLVKPEMYNPVHIEQLQKALQAFVWTCGFAISLNRSLIGPQHIQFQKMVESQYKILKEKVSKFVNPTASSGGSNSFISSTSASTSISSNSTLNLN